MSNRLIHTCDGCSREAEDQEAHESWYLCLEVAITSQNPSALSPKLLFEHVDLCKSCADKLIDRANPRTWARIVRKEWDSDGEAKDPPVVKDCGRRAGLYHGFSREDQ